MASAIPSLFELCCDSFSKNIGYLYKGHKRFPIEYVPLDVHEKLISLCARKTTLSDETLEVFIHESLTKLRLSNANMLIGDSSILRIASTCKYLTELSLYGTSNISEQVLAESFKSFPNLEVLNLTKCTVASKMVLDFASIFCPKLKMLLLNRNPQVNDSYFEDCIDKWPQLYELGLLSCMNITGKTLEILSKSSVKLESLNISKCALIKDEQLIPLIRKSGGKLQSLRISRLRHLTDATLDAIIEYLPNIFVIDMSACSFSEEATIRLVNASSNLISINLHKDSDAILEAIAEKCPRIEEIVLPRAGKISDKAVVHLTKCQYLKTLNLSKCTKLSDTPFQAFFRAVTRLTDLNISNCNALTTNVFSGLIPAVNTNLGTLDFGNSVAVKVEFFENLSIYAPNLSSLAIPSAAVAGDSITTISRSFPLLHTLIINSNPITDEDVKTIAHGRWRLRTLNINDCAFVTEKAVLYLLSTWNQLENLYASKCALIGALSSPIDTPKKKSQLIELDLSYCSLLTDETLAAFLSVCENLQNLNVSKCEKLSDSSVNSIIHFPNLFFLNYSKTLISDAFIDKLTSSLTRINYLNLSGCIYLTDKAAISILSRLPFLLTLHLALVSDVTDASIQTLIDKKRTKLQLLALTSTGVTQNLAKELQKVFPTMQIHYGNLSKHDLLN